MKLNRSYLFIAISSTALIAVLIIQVNWILQTAQVKEDLFNEKANIVLSRTIEALNIDKETCMKIEEYADRTSSITSESKLGSDEVRTIDSLFNNYMRFYNFHVGYTFEVVKPQQFNVTYGSGFANNTYNKRLNEFSNMRGVELKLILPDKKQYIIAEMGTLFITSVVLILVVLFLFWRTMLSLMREKQLSEHTTEFLNNMTHEFKTPLTNIALAGKMLIKDTASRQDDKIKYYTTILLEENEKLRYQVEEVLSMTALERGEIPLQKTELDFHELIKDAIKHIAIQIENKQGNLNVNLEAEQFIVIGDRIQLTNAISNLIDNAIKYSNERPEIVIETKTLGQNLIITFRDNGIGIEKKYQKKVFDKYFRVPTGDLHDVKGFGLGLAYIKKIIERM